MTRVREIEALVHALEAGALSRREFLGCALVAGLGTAIGEVTIHGRGFRSTASSKLPAQTYPGASEEWLSHPPYRALPGPSSRPSW